MNKLLPIIACFFLLQLSAQTSMMKVSLQMSEYHHEQENADTFNIYILKNNDTINCFRMNEYDYVEMDSLEEGVYKIYVYNNNDFEDEYIYKNYFTLQPDQITTVEIDLSTREYTEDLEPVDFQKSELQIGLGYFNGNWAGGSPVIKDNLSLTFTGFGYVPFSKHVGFLIGGGFGFSQHYFYKDTTLFSGIPFQKKYERYSSITLNYEAKFRISSGNQRIYGTSDHKFFVDLGAGYYLPLLFNHTAMYKGSKKIVDRNIHNFNDFRVFANVGYGFVTAFVEYRLVDFMRGNYAQLPRYNVGVKFMIPTD